MLLDCGLMFPDADMLGIDLVLPDFTYLRENADRIDGCIATHGHEDHVGGLSFLLRELSFPIYGSPLTLGLARNRIEEAGLLGRTELIPVADGERRQIGPFDVEFIPVTHSVPHGFATAFHTPAGRDPALGRLQARPHARSTAGSPTSPAWAPSPTTEGIRLLLADSTNADEHGHAPIASASVGAVLYDLFHAARGPAHHHGLLRQPHPPHPADRRRRHRVRPRRGHARAVDEEERAPGPRDGAAAHPRRRRCVDIEDVDDLAPAKVCVISTGSQGEPMSALALHGRRREPLAQARRATTR